MSVFTDEVVISNTPLPTDGSGVTQPVSAVSLPLPSGAATDTSVQALTKPSDIQLVDGSAHTQPVSGPLTDTQLRATPVPVSGSVSTTPLAAASSTVVQVTSTGSNQTLLASNASRKKAVFFFESGIWELKLGATASSSSKTWHISSSNTAIEVDVYTGTIDAICTTAGKLVDVTELS